MRTFRKIVRIGINKYLLATGGFIALMLFFDHNDIFTQLDRKKALTNARAAKTFYSGEIDKTRKELADFQHNPAAFEQYAREHYYMKRDNEDIFIVQPDSTTEHR